MNRVAAACVIAAMVGPGLSGCSKESPDWRPITAEELKALPGYENRTGPGGDFLSATGDFNGDRVPDRVVFMRDMTDGMAQFMVILGANKGVMPVGGFRPEDIPKVGVARVPPGVYHLACEREEGVATACEAPNVTFEKDAINIFAFNSTGTYMYYLGGGFRNLGMSERPTL